MVNAFSILIPVFNFNIVPLVDQLLEIARKSGKKFEILLIDDNSQVAIKQQNNEVLKHSEINYIELTENIGRSKIRNLLFQKAKYEYCIILDCDVLIAKENFLDLYFEQLTTNNVVVGGHVYLPNPPKDESKYFHWLYGRKIEVQAPEERLKHPYASFMTNSFGISKSLFNTLKFDESISEYGHEDTLFGFELKNRNIEIVHINSPVVHLGLESEKLFIAKQEKAIKNLVMLYNQGVYQSELESSVRLIKFYKLFYHKFPYNILISMISTLVNLSNKIFDFKFLKLTWFNLWKLKKFDHYSNKL